MKREFTRYPFPPFRRATADLLEAAARKHMIHAMFEVDVTHARRTLKKAWKYSGYLCSLTSYIVYCTARAVGNNKRLHAYQNWRGQVVEFEDVDVSVPIERYEGNQSLVVPLIIRAADKKSLEAIDKEIEAAKRRKIDEAGLYRFVSWYVRIPRFIRRCFFRVLDRTPRTLKSKVGTVMVSSVGMFGRQTGWGIPVASHTTNITVGGMVRRPVLTGDTITQAEMLCLTVSFDHVLVDGGPAARFVRRFTKLVETGSGIL